jgi:hypothetical protein
MCLPEVSPAEPRGSQLEKCVLNIGALFKSLLGETVYGVREIMKRLRNAHVIGRAVI